MFSIWKKRWENFRLMLDNYRLLVDNQNDYMLRLRALQYQTKQLTEKFDRQLSISADMSVANRDLCHIIAVGHFRGHDYVEVFSMRGEVFSSQVQRLLDTRKHGTIDRIDAPVSARAFITEELRNRF